MMFISEEMLYAETYQDYALNWLQRAIGNDLWWEYSDYVKVRITASSSIAEADNDTTKILQLLHFMLIPRGRFTN